METLETRRLLAGDSLIITEFMAANSDTLRDRFREYSDWVEIHNPTDQPIELDDWRLTDDPTDLAKWQFPESTLSAGGYLVVFASGEDRAEADSELHTNFRLGSDGDYLALVRADGAIAHAYFPQYPQQYSDISFGIAFDEQGPQLGQHYYFVVPTPGEPNSDSTVTGRTTEVTASVERGFFDVPFDVTLATRDSRATILYTTDGTAPSPDHGEVFTQPFTVSTTTTLRAVSYAEGALPGEVMTQTYVFLADVLEQDGAGLPDLWGYYDDQGPPRPARHPANYAMDPEIVNHSTYRDTILDDLRSVPTLSLVMDPNDLWDFENGIYSNPERRGDDWERASSMEWISKDGQTLFQSDAGLLVHGGWARRFTYTSKLSFRVAFRAEYGDTTLNVPLYGPEGQTEFQQLVLRGGFNDSWQSGDRRNTYMQDQWTRQAQRDLGGFAPRDRYVHLYLNGLYWGLYSVTERPDALWAASNQGGDADEYDVINTSGGVIDGDTGAWRDLSRAIAGNPVDYQAVEQLLDIDDFIDYMIVNQLVGNWDWPHNNWFMSRRRIDGAKWHFHSWDAEAAFQDGLTADRVDPRDIRSSVGPSNIYLKLIQVPEFQQRFADRVYKHLFNDGALTSQANVDRLNAIAAQIDRAIVGESARWGDGRVDQVSPAVTRNSVWIPRIRAINDRYFPDRNDRLAAQYLEAGLYSAVDAPRFDPTSGHVTPESDIRLIAEEGDIFFTTDGSDPRLPDGSASSNAKTYDTVSLVSGISPARWLIPQGAASEVQWQDRPYDDGAWSEGSATFGFETGISDDPLEMRRGFRVREVHSSEQLNTWDDVDRLLGGENVESTKSFARVPVINYLQGGRGGFFEDDQPFPNGGTSNLALDISGTLDVNRAGTYTFGVSSNDAARLEIDDSVLFEDAERHGASDVSLVTIDLDEGSHDLRLVMFERLGSAVLEFFYAPGTKTEMDEDFQLVNDLKHRSYADIVRTDLESQMANQHTSVYARIPFMASDIDQITQLTLQTRFDDGFVAYLNGVEVARHSAPDNPSFDATATATRQDSDALQVETFDVPGYANLLGDGQNVLAIHALNAQIDDPDMLFSTRLVGRLTETPIHLTESTVLKARVYLDGEWSPLAQTDFRVSVPAGPNDVRVSEVHYHPRQPDDAEIAAGFDDVNDFEFIEIVNVSDQTIDLSDVSFEPRMIAGQEQGIEFDFADSAVRELAPGARLVVVEDLEAFALRYGAAIPVAGQWRGRLSNSSETITLVAGDALVQQFTYDDGWYRPTDGGGPSLEFIRARDAALEQWSQPAYWRPGVVDGTPGKPRVDLPGDTNRDGRFDSTDLVLAFQAGEYEDGVADNSTWEEGDWDGDGDFDTSDLIFAFAAGLYSRD